MSQRLVRPSRPAPQEPARSQAQPADPALAAPLGASAEPAAQMSDFDKFIERTRARLEEISAAPPSELVAVALPGGGHMMVERVIGSNEPPFRIAPSARLSRR